MSDGLHDRLARGCGIRAHGFDGAPTDRAEGPDALYGGGTL